MSEIAWFRQLTYTSAMQSAPENIQFFFGSQVVGYFEDQPPSSAGQYRYMPFRGPGHLCLVQELARKGPQYCHYVANGETRYFTVARLPNVHVLEVSELVPSPVSRILEPGF
jgi:hypothetical protein